MRETDEQTDRQHGRPYNDRWQGWRLQLARHCKLRPAGRAKKGGGSAGRFFILKLKQLTGVQNKNKEKEDHQNLILNKVVKENFGKNRFSSIPKIPLTTTRCKSTTSRCKSTTSRGKSE